MQRLIDRINVDLATHNRFNKWYELGPFKVYLRFGQRLLAYRTYERTLTVANVTCSEQGKGIFKQFERAIRCNHEVEAVLIENVIEQRFQQFFSNLGYTRIEPAIPSWPPSYFRLNVAEDPRTPEWQTGYDMGLAGTAYKNHYPENAQQWIDFRGGYETGSAERPQPCT